MQGNIFIEKQCDICGKDIYPTPMWVYKIWDKQYTRRWFCSYSCMNKGKKKYGRMKEFE